MNENALMELTFTDRTGTRTVPIMDCSIAQILRYRHSKGFRQGFMENPYLEKITLRQVVSSPLAMGNFLQSCRGLPHCGDTTIHRLFAVIETLAAAEVDQNSDLRRVTTQ